MRNVKAALSLVFLLCLIATVHNLHRANRAIFQADFHVYYNAAELVLHGESQHIYDGADTDQDAQLKFSDPGTVYTQMASRHGMDQIRLYIYPPILADLLAPVGLLPLHAAEAFWILLNVAALLLTGWMLSRILEIRLTGAAGLALSLSLFLPVAVGMCFIWGQITLILLVLWTVGLYGYARGNIGLSAFALGLATAIKLTPLIVVAPMLLWQDWRWLRNYALSLVACVAAMCLFSHPAVLADYFNHVVPSMSRGWPNTENKSLGSFVQVLYVALHGIAFKASGAIEAPLPHGILTFSKLSSLLAIGAVLVVLARSGRALPLGARLVALALLASVAVCVAPVSWRHAYVFGILPLAFLWSHALRHCLPTAQLVVLTLCSIELSSFFFEDLMAHFLHSPVELAVQTMFAPLAGIVLALYFMAPRRLCEVAPAHLQTA